MSELPSTGGGGLDGSGSTLLDEQTETKPNYTYEDGDEERFSHYVPKEKLLAAMIDGIPVKALCGKMWVPTRDPERFPICPQCKDIFDKMKR